MTDIRKKARVLLNAAREAHVNPDDYLIGQTAVCLAIEQHEAFKQEVSDVVESITSTTVDDGVWRGWASDRLSKFIIPKPKPDPLVEVLTDTFGASLIDAKELRAALEARGLEIREKDKCQ
jgi:hypothetical protein